MNDRFLRNFGALYALLEQPKAAQRAVVGLLAIHTCLLAYSAYVHSPTSNEPAHLVAGLSHWKFGRFDLYRVNPPLVRMVAALPVMATGYKEDWSRFYHVPGARPVFSIGHDFVAANGERTSFLVMIARWACIPFSWLGAVVCYLWARDLYSRPAGVLACAFWCFEPNLQAHASLMTPDAHAAALGIATCYTFWCWLRKPTWSRTVFAGLVLGLAELAKTTLILFYPLWPVMWLIYRWPRRQSMDFRTWIREAGMLALRMLIGLYVLNLGYGFEGVLIPLEKYHFVSELFTRNEIVVSADDSTVPDKAITDNQSAGHNNYTLHHNNRFSENWFGSLPVPIPQNYLLGIDIQQRDFENYDKRSYLGGEWSDRGWWYYYLYALSVKLPLGLILLGLLRTICLSFSSGTSVECQNLDSNAKRSLLDHFVLLFPPIVIFVVVSSKTGFSEHMRYVFPSLPFLFIAIAGIAQVYSLPLDEINQAQLVDKKLGRTKLLLNTLGWVRLNPIVVGALTCVLGCWFISSSMWIYPHNISYFNESIGGPVNGFKHLRGSSLDWGQDDHYLRDYVSGLGDKVHYVVIRFNSDSSPEELDKSIADSKLKRVTYTILLKE
jgi:hypothetical protein